MIVTAMRLRRRSVTIQTACCHNASPLRLMVIHPSVSIRSVSSPIFISRVFVRLSRQMAYPTAPITISATAAGMVVLCLDSFIRTPSCPRARRNHSLSGCGSVAGRIPSTGISPPRTSDSAVPKRQPDVLHCPDKPTLSFPNPDRPRVVPWARHVRAWRPTTGPRLRRVSLSGPGQAVALAVEPRAKVRSVLCSVSGWIIMPPAVPGMAGTGAYCP